MRHSAAVTGSRDPRCPVDVDADVALLGDEGLDGGLGRVLEAIVQEIERSAPGIVVVDSFRAMMRSTSRAK